MASTPVVSETLALTVYLDGFVLVNHELELNQTYPSVNITLLGEAHKDILVVDEKGLPLDYSVVDGKATIYSLNATQIKISYFTPDLTSKTGKYWTLGANVSISTKVIMPEDATIISLNNVPELIESSNGQVSLVMASGTIEITYIAEHSLHQPTSNYEILQFIPIVSSLTAFGVLALWFIRRKKPLQLKKSASEVDLDKLLEREKYLRPEEVQAIHFLAEKHGTAFEAELYEKLGLPRTTMWRLLKRLEKMEIVDIQKSRRQNIISIRKKCLKK
ncbi:MAG: hypothetical protein NWF09_00800 [Candidatus Bathyarchaeota archaeon]|nr:hypothetical protein [Candidatus Bathyarchaeota archaeon]